MCIHLAARTEGLILHIRICIELRKKLLHSSEPAGKHKCLVPIISGTEITGFEKLGHSDLRHFFAIAENAEFSFTGEHLFTPQQTRLPAYACIFVIA